MPSATNGYANWENCAMQTSFGGDYLNTVLEINRFLLSTPRAIITIITHYHCYGQHGYRLAFCGFPCSSGKVRKLLSEVERRWLKRKKKREQNQAEWEMKRNSKRYLIASHAKPWFAQNIVKRHNLKYDTPWVCHILWHLSWGYMDVSFSYRVSRSRVFW